MLKTEKIRRKKRKRKWRRENFF